MFRRALVLAATTVVLVACGAAEPTPRELTSGEITPDTYGELIAKDGLTIEDVEAEGAIVSEDLERDFVAEGGFPALDVDRCRYARTLVLSAPEDEQYEGTARFCFDAQDRSVSVERNPVEASPVPTD
ncbi:hypothetical protein [Aeromicrobium sp. Sec7.5]|uniref:hypothetical protein n=1 Tax=Aeromicrobium sp. Sec7.5 TaxID=3121276 RepID=UPI002FE4E0B6